MEDFKLKHIRIDNINRKLINTEHLIISLAHSSVVEIKTFFISFLTP